MKIKFKFAAMLAAVALFSITSCNKTPEAPVNDETGILKVTLELPNDVSDETRATASTARPTTSWTGNIKSMMIMFANASGVVVDARDLPLSTATGIAQEIRTVNNIPTGTYTVYIVANYDQINTAGQTSISTGTPAWTIGNVRGKNVSTLLLSLVTSTAFTATSTEAGFTGYFSPAELFVASQGSITITADVTYTHPTVFALTRAVSMFRTRITLGSLNTNVDFANASADIRIRRIATSVTPAMTYAPGTKVSTQQVYNKGAFNTANPTTGYTNGTTMLASGQKYWKDVLIYPGGHATTNSQMFEVVVGGMAPAGYIPIDQNMANLPALTAPAMVWWRGIVEQQAVGRNQILEVDLSVNSAGMDVPPPSTSTGNLIINVSLVNWAEIFNVDVTM